ncbi:hypothetical protein WM21_11860 [Burkholderia ubonensis]|nr:hypothetical protein WM21_11860 [Burkholderia ubonensis]
MSAVRLPFAAEDAGREITRRADDDPFDRAVELVLGPTGGDLDRALADALALRDAAQRAADKLQKRLSATK